MTYLIRIGIIFIIAGSISAQETWTLNDTWNVLLQNNYKLRTQENLIRQSETEIFRNRSLFYPELTATSNYRYQSEIAKLTLPFPGADKIQAGTNSQYDFTISLSQSVFTGFRRMNLLRISRVQHDLRIMTDDLIKQQLMLRAGLLYYDIQKNKLQEKTLLTSLGRAENQLLRIRNLLKAKQATEFDTLETANRKIEIQNNIHALRDYNEILRARLSDIVHVENIPELAPLNIQFEDSLSRDLAQWQNQGLLQRKDLIQVLKTVELQGHQTDVYRSNYYPQIYANVSYHYARPGVNFFLDEWMKFYTVGIYLEWNLWNWNRDALSIQKSILEEQRIDLYRNELEINIKNEVRQAYLQILTAEKQVELQKQLVNLEEERYRITSERFGQGLTTILDVNSAEQSLTSAQLQLQQNIINWYTAKLQLAYAVGDIIAVK